MKRLLKRFLLFLVTIAIVMIAWFSFSGYVRYAKAVEEKTFPEMVSEIESRENYTPYEELPEMYVKAVISIEDKRFETHDGFDVIGIARALFTDITTMSFKEGGSTITEQLMKNLYFDQEKHIERRIAQLFASIAFEKAYDKETVFALYASTAYFGSGYEGIREASIGYFNKLPEDLTNSEAIILAGIPQAPSIYDPTVNPDLCLARTKQVAESMEKDGILSKEDLKQFQEEAQSFFLLLSKKDKVLYLVLDNCCVE